MSTPRPSRSREASSEELALEAQAGSSASFAELVARYEAPLFNFLLMRVRSAEDAEELVQDAFLRAWRKIDLYKSQWKFSTWLFTLARHLAASRLRAAPARLARSARSDGEEALHEQGVTCDPSGDLSDTEERANLWSLAGRVLTTDQRSALWLRYAEDHSVAEIAAVLGRSSVAVRVLLFRARETLGRHLDPVHGREGQMHARDGTVEKSTRGEPRPPSPSTRSSAAMPPLPQVPQVPQLQSGPRAMRENLT